MNSALNQNTDGAMSHPSATVVPLSQEVSTLSADQT